MAKQFSRIEQIIGLMVCLVLCYSASAIGVVASIDASGFYTQLVQPSWAPPPWLFGPVWTLLYAMMAFALWLVWREGGVRKNRVAISAFLFQLALNALWSWLFFAWRLGAWALLEILALAIGILISVVLFQRVKKSAALLLLPYLVWVLFASGLNYALLSLNPDLL